jgi:hypothetical protein
MRVEISKLYVDAADELLVPSGFVRRARSQEWSKRSEVDRIWVHLNFGKGLVNPSFGVEYSDLKKRWPNLPGGVYGTMKMLVGCVKTPRLYSVNDAACDLIDDLRESGIVVMAELSRSNEGIGNVAITQQCKMASPFIFRSNPARTHSALRVGPNRGSFYPCR